MALIGFSPIFFPDKRENIDPRHYYSDLSIRFYTSNVAAIVTKLFGSLSTVHLPVSLRKPLYGSYAWFFGCQMHEAVEESLTAYPTFAAFFNRELKPELRPISRSMLVSPADGIVTYFGKVESGLIEFVKGKDYQVHDFLGPINVDTKSGNALYQMVIYLAPGDYHAFHSPAKWRVLEKIHHPGLLQTVKPWYLLKNPNVFVENERMVLSGQWKYGYFSMTAVAATNVGSIAILNEPVKNRKLLESEKFELYDEKMSFKPGDKVGEFRIGSTIVLIFEAPEDLQLFVEAGNKLRYGQSLVREQMPTLD